MPIGMLVGVVRCYWERCVEKSTMLDHSMCLDVTMLALQKLFHCNHWQYSTKFQKEKQNTSRTHSHHNTDGWHLIIPLSSLFLFPFCLAFPVVSVLLHRYVLGFYFWLDVASTLSLLPDIGWIWNPMVGGETTVGAQSAALKGAKGEFHCDQHNVLIIILRVDCVENLTCDSLLFFYRCQSWIKSRKSSECCFCTWAFFYLFSIFANVNTSTQYTHFNTHSGGTNDFISCLYLVVWCTSRCVLFVLCVWYVLSNCIKWRPVMNPWMSKKTQVQNLPKLVRKPIGFCVYCALCSLFCFLRSLCSV